MHGRPAPRRKRWRGAPCSSWRNLRLRWILPARKHGRYSSLQWAHLGLGPAVFNDVAPAFRRYSEAPAIVIHLRPIALLGVQNNERRSVFARCVIELLELANSPCYSRFCGRASGAHFYPPVYRSGSIRIKHREELRSSKKGRLAVSKYQIPDVEFSRRRA